eukprot:SM000122S25800  [mRNA]  locus=s122:364543:367690:- [translate_table: standard]
MRRLDQQLVRSGIGGGGGGGCGPFTAAQWRQLEQQALAFKFLYLGFPPPPDLVAAVCQPPPPAAAAAASFPLTSPPPTQSPHGPWGALQIGGVEVEPEPHRCRRTDGKKWRCALNVLPAQKYCEKHMHRGRHRGPCATAKLADGGGAAASAAASPTSPSSSVTDGSRPSSANGGSDNGATGSPSEMQRIPSLENMSEETGARKRPALASVAAAATDSLRPSSSASDYLQEVSRKASCQRSSHGCDGGPSSLQSLHRMPSLHLDSAGSSRSVAGGADGHQEAAPGGRSAYFPPPVPELKGLAGYQASNCTPSQLSGLQLWQQGLSLQGKAMAGLSDLHEACVQQLPQHAAAADGGQGRLYNAAGGPLLPNAAHHMLFEEHPSTSRNGSVPSRWEDLEQQSNSLLSATATTGALSLLGALPAPLRRAATGETKLQQSIAQIGHVPTGSELPEWIPVTWETSLSSSSAAAGPLGEALQAGAADAMPLPLLNPANCTRGGSLQPYYGLPFAV